MLSDKRRTTKGVSSEIGEAFAPACKDEQVPLVSFYHETLQ